MAHAMLIVGVGQRHRRDDAAGLEAAARVAASNARALSVRTCDGDCTTLIDLWAGASTVIVIDAMSSGQPPGTIARLSPHDRSLPATCSRSSSHAIGLAEAIELSRALGCLPPRLTVFAIEGEDFGFGDCLSPAVDAAVDAVVREITRERQD